MTSPLSSTKTNEAASATSSVQPETKTGKLNGWQVTVSNTPDHMRKLEQEIKKGEYNEKSLVMACMTAVFGVLMLPKIDDEKRIDGYIFSTVMVTIVSSAAAVVLLSENMDKYGQSQLRLRNIKDPDFAEWANKKHLLLSKNNLESCNRGFEFDVMYKQI